MQKEERQLENGVSQVEEHEEVNKQNEDIIMSIEDAVNNALSGYITDIVQKKEAEKKAKIEEEAKKACEWIPDAVMRYVKRHNFTEEKAKQPIHIDLTISENIILWEEVGYDNEIIHTSQESEYFIDALKLLSKLSKRSGSAGKGEISIEVPENKSMISIDYTMG